MASVHICVSHDDDPAVAQSFDIKGLTDPGAQGRDQGFDLIIREDFIQPGAFGVENLPAQRQDGLEMPVTALFGRTTRRITLHDVQFGVG